MFVIDRAIQFSDLAASDTGVLQSLYYSRFCYSDLLARGGNYPRIEDNGHLHLQP